MTGTGSSNIANGIGWPLLLVLIGVSGIGPVSMNGVLPANSAILREMETSYGLTQMTFTVFLVATLVSQLVLGPIADVCGRRVVMLGSLLVFVIGSVLCAVSPGIEVLLAARFIQGLGAAACTFMPRTVVRDIYPRDRAASVIGYMTTAMMVAPLFGPAVGGWVTDHSNWRYLYVGLAVLGTLLLLLGARFQRETLSRRAAADSASHTVIRTPTHSLWSASGTLLRLRAFNAYSLMMAGSVGVYYTFLGSAPFVAMESRGTSASVYGAWFVMVAIGYLIGNLIAGRFSERVGVTRMIGLGLIPLLAGLCLFWLFSGWHHPMALFLPMQLIALSNGMSLPNMISGAMSVQPELSASASGLASSLQTAFGVLLTVTVGYLLPAGDHWLFIGFTVSVLVTVAGYLLGKSTERLAMVEPVVNAARR